MNSDPLELDRLDAQAAPPPMSARERRWAELLQVAPRLASLYRKSWNQVPAPHPLSDGLFLALAACFADPAKRDLLRALVLDLLADDLEEIITVFLTDVPDDGKPTTDSRLPAQKG